MPRRHFGDAPATARDSERSSPSAPLTVGQINRLMLELRFAIDADELPPLLLIPPDAGQR
jgi:hypothetical protein